MTTPITLEALESMSAEAISLNHPQGAKLLTLLKSARGYRKALIKIEHLTNVQGERWAAAQVRHYRPALERCMKEIDVTLAEMAG